MRLRAPLISGVVLLELVVVPCAALPQKAESFAPVPSIERNFPEKQSLTYPLLGRVTTLRGRPVEGAKVVVDIGGSGHMTRVLKTDFRGEFHADCQFDPKRHKAMSVRLEAFKPGYSKARETMFLDSENGFVGTHLVLREREEDSDVLPQANMIATLGSLLRHAAPSSLPSLTREDYARAAEKLLDENDAVEAASNLERVVKNQPECSPCRTLLALAMLGSGSWESADREFHVAAALETSSGGREHWSEPFVALGTLDTWRHQLKTAEAQFRKALELAPSSPLALRELGRTLLIEGKWKVADEILKKAADAGGSPEAHLLRARALLTGGEVKEAEREMNTYMGGRKPRELPPGVRAVYADLRERLSTASYSGAASVVDQTPAELAREMPELEGLEAAESQRRLPEMLTKLGEYVDAFFRNFSNTVSAEEIHEEKLRSGGRVGDSGLERFQYLLLVNPERPGLGLNEFRTRPPAASEFQAHSQKGFMRTAGFATASIVFHPAYQPGSRFRYVGRQLVDGQPVDIVGFAQIPGKAPIIEAFIVSAESSFPLLLQGLAWVDPASYRIVRLRMDALYPPPNSRLTRQTTEISFGEVRFKQSLMAVSLPRDVVVSLEWNGHSFRNRHHYSDFKLFGAETSIRTADDPDDREGSKQ